MADSSMGTRAPAGAAGRGSVQATGVDIIDRAIGGLAPGLPVILAGPSGCGRTVLALQLAAAALARGEAVAYLCNEPPPFLLQQACTLELGIDFESAVDLGQLVLLEMDPMAATLVRAHGVAALIDAVRTEEPLCATLVVDPVTALLSEIHDDAAMRAEARELVRHASPMKVVLTAETEQLALQRGLDRVLSEVAGSFLSLAREEASGQRWLRVDKNRNGPMESDRLRFTIGSGGASAPAGAEPPPYEPPAEEPTGPHRDSSPAPASRAVPAGPAPPTEDKGPPVVLVVDDDPSARGTLAKWLEPDYGIVTARDGFEAMTCVAAGRPDLVVLDLIMPRVTGYELIVALQRVAEDVPVLVTSSRVARPSDRIGPLVLGATDMLSKHVDRFELLHKVEMLMRLDGAPRRWLDPGDAEALFATVSESRRLEEGAFLQRMDRAHRFGERYALPASLVAVAGPSKSAIDDLEAAVDANLRFEDALYRVSQRRALILLVAIEPAEADAVVDRILDQMDGGAARRRRFETRVFAARAGGESPDWHGFFRGEEGAE
jgi:CheY-like chemotaxis protein/KaiC/GvpD/RAD55 family RecA-like ATPase